MGSGGSSLSELGHGRCLPIEREALKTCPPSAKFRGIGPAGSVFIRVHLWFTPAP